LAILSFLSACSELKVKSTTLKDARDTKLSHLIKEQAQSHHLISKWVKKLEENDNSVQQISSSLEEISKTQEGSEEHRALCESIIERFKLESTYDMVID
jgi:CTP-dependent riboflavin kinase